jgi:hypothetical protein
MVKNRVLIVTGMHRSGTSLVTRWLNSCGLHVGEELIGAETGNEDGHFEDVDFLHAHQSILKGRRITDEGYTGAIPELSNEEKDTLNGIITYKNGFHQQWGWKDPRTCLFLDTYRQLIPAAFYFVVLRGYRSVVSSLIQRIYKRTEKKYSLRTGLSRFIWEHFKKKRRMRMLLKKYSQRYLKVWIAYNEAIASHLKHLPADNYLVTDFAILCNEDETVFRHITQQWGFSLNFTGFTTIFRKSQVHKPADIDAYVKDKTLLDRAAAAEATLRRMSIFNGYPQALYAV